MPAILLHENILHRFKKLLASGRLAHAYLLVGPWGVGKFETAFAIAKLVNCENPDPSDLGFCDQCPPCRKINTNGHPDVHILESGRGETIKIEQIRDLIVQTQMRPFEAKKKIFIIRNSENVTTEAGNALLKTLEEPSAESLLLLTTSLPEKNLSTIKSRCHRIYIAPQTNARLADYLVKDYDMKDSSAGFLASFAEGCLARAEKLNEADAVKSKNEAVNNFIFSRDSEVYLKKVLASPEETKQLLDILLSWFRDLLMLKLGQPETRLVHQDRVQDLKTSAQKLTAEGIQAVIDQIVTTTRLFNDKLNVKIALSLIKEKIWVK